MTSDVLKSYSVKDLAEMAKKRGVRGWHEMRKQDLVKAILRLARKTAAQPARKASPGQSAARRAGTPNSKPRFGKPAFGKPGFGKPGFGKPGFGKPRPGTPAPSASSGQSARKTAAAFNRVPPYKPVAPFRPAAPAAKPTAAFKPAANATKTAGVSKPSLSQKSTSLSKAIGSSKPSLVQKPVGVVSKPVALAKPLLAPQKALAAQKTAIAQKDIKDKKLSLVAKRILIARLKQDRMKDLAWRTAENNGRAPVRDRLVVMVRDAFWLHCFWELSRQGVERAQAALAQDWHSAKPVLRLLSVAEGGTTSSAEGLIRDVEIHGGVNNWYLEAIDPPKSFRIEIGYRAANGRFQMLARSNVVTTPRPDSKDVLDENWNAVAEDYDKIFALSGGYSHDGHSTELKELFEERLRRPMGTPMETGFGSGVEGLVPRHKSFIFEVDAELIVFGKTEPNAHVTLQGEPVRVRPDGTFTVRYSMPNARQVIPAVASSVDGLEQRTVVLAVERNTKVMEPIVKDSND